MTVVGEVEFSFNILHVNSSWLCQASILTGNREIKATWAFQLKKRTWSFAFDLVVGWGMGLGSYLGDKCHNQKKTMNLKFNCEIWCLKPGLAQIIVIFSFCGWESLPHSSRSASKIMGWNGVGLFLHNLRRWKHVIPKRKDQLPRLECTCKDQSIDPRLTSCRGLRPPYHAGLSKALGPWCSPKLSERPWLTWPEICSWIWCLMAGAGTWLTHDMTICRLNWGISWWWWSIRCGA